MKQAFLKRMDGYEAFAQLLDLLPDVAFFMKDQQGRFVMHNRRSCEYCCIASEEETLGLTDFDFYPKDRATMYLEGDRQEMKTGSPILNAIAPAPEHAGSEQLIIYSNIPVKNRRGRIMGLSPTEYRKRHAPR